MAKAIRLRGVVIQVLETGVDFVKVDAVVLNAGGVPITKIEHTFKDVSLADKQNIQPYYLWNITPAYNVEVVKILEGPEKIHGGYKVKVKAKEDNGKTFDYVFIKSEEADINEITIGYKWDMYCKPNSN